MGGKEAKNSAFGFYGRREPEYPAYSWSLINPRLELRTSHGKERAMMAIPVTRESLRRIVHRFESEKFMKARMAGFDLRARGPPVIGKVIAASESDREIDQYSAN